MTVQKKTEFHSDAINYFKELPFYNTHIEKPKFKRLKNIDLLPELISIIKTNQPFKGYPLSYKVELIEKRIH